MMRHNGPGIPITTTQAVNNIREWIVRENRREMSASDMTVADITAAPDSLHSFSAEPNYREVLLGVPGVNWENRLRNGAFSPQQFCRIAQGILNDWDRCLAELHELQDLISAVVRVRGSALAVPAETAPNIRHSIESDGTASDSSELSQRGALVAHLQGNQITPLLLASRRSSAAAPPSFGEQTLIPMQGALNPDPFLMVSAPPSSVDGSNEGDANMSTSAPTHPIEGPVLSRSARHYNILRLRPVYNSPQGATPAEFLAAPRTTPRSPSP